MEAPNDVDVTFNEVLVEVPAGATAPQDSPLKIGCASGPRTFVAGAKASLFKSAAIRLRMLPFVALITFLT
jgi:hypothetical protein